MSRSLRRVVLRCVLLTAALTGCADGEHGGDGPAGDRLAALGHTVTTGAAPGYIDDEACRLCHAEIWASYESVGMARSFYRPRADTLAEDFDAPPLYHEPSARYYAMRRDGDGLVFRRWQLDGSGAPINEFEIGVDWVLGSGNHARSYLFQTEVGELFMLPINWYSQTGEWGMSPGFERADHFGVTRRVRRECMFCHNAYPDVAEGSDLDTGVQRFPHELPEGTGCQRCHGPGAEHVRAAFEPGSSPEAVRDSIVNPARLDVQRRNDVCHECHMQPSVVLTSVRRFERGEYSFRPGESLSAYKVALDPVIHGEADRSERFEINHHPYRLEQSPCFIESEGALECLTCHDPHRVVPEPERAEHYRAACVGCHALDGRLDDAHGDVVTELAASDCASCHMPERRTQDVVLVTMTDHLIRRDPGGAELVAPIDPGPEPRFVGVELADPARAPTGVLADVYRAVGTLRSDANVAAVEFLERALPETGIADPTVWLDLAQGQLALGRLPDAERTLQRVLAERPDHALALESLGVARLIARDSKAAATHLRRAADLNPLRHETQYNLGLALEPDRPHAALAAFDRAIELRPNSANAWFSRGRTLERLERLEPAVTSYRRALEIEPRLGPGYLALAGLLDRLGRPRDATRFLRHGASVADRPGPLRDALTRRGEAS